MRGLFTLLVFPFFLLASLGAAAGEPKSADIPELVEKLGSPLFADRQKAADALVALGKPAEDAVRRATQGPDAERRRLATGVLKQIENRLLAEKLLGPTRLRLTLAEVPMRDALHYLASISGGQPLVLDFDVNDPNVRKKVTLDTGDTTFWEAFDQLCRTSGLVEHATAPPSWPQPSMLGAPVQRMQWGAQPMQGFGAPQFGGQQAVWPQLGMGYGASHDSSGVIRLVAGKATRLLCAYAGGLRIRALRSNLISSHGAAQSITSWDPAMGQTATAVSPADSSPRVALDLEVLHEARIQWQGITGVRVKTAVDDRGQLLTQVFDTTAIGVNGLPPAFVPLGSTYVPLGGGMQTVQLKCGSKSAKTIRELHGVVTVQMQTPVEVLMAVADALKPGTKAVRCNDGGRLQVMDASRDDFGYVRLRVRFDAPSDVSPAPLTNAATTQQPLGMPPAMQGIQGRQFVLQGQFQPVGNIVPGRGVPAFVSGPFGLGLVDSRKQYCPVNLVNTEIKEVRGEQVVEYLLVSSSKIEAGAAQCVFSGSRTVMLDVPFTLKDVPLP